VSDISEHDRFGAGAAPRSTAIPRIVVSLGVVGALLLAGVGINAFVYKILNVGGVVEERTSSSQLATGEQAPFSYPPETPAPPRTAQTPPPTTNNPPAPQPGPTVADRIGQTVGVSPARSIMEPAPSGWGDIGRDYAARAASSRSGGYFGSQQTPAEKAAAAFGGRVRSPDLEGSRATAVYDLQRTLRPGTRLFCTTQQAIDTTTGAGTFVCDVDYWVPAWDGVTPLIPPHSWVTARYEELRNGANRVFAASGILTTPDGVVVSLGDPFTMPDGSNGVEGVVQDNTWPRLKEGIILDFFQSAFQAATSLAAQNNGGGNGSSNLNFTFQPTATQQAVQAIIEKNMSIKDVLRLAQGAHISMTILQPIFFQDAVAFTMRPTK